MVTSARKEEKISIRPSTEEEVLRAVTGRNIRRPGPGEVRRHIDRAQQEQRRRQRAMRRDGITALLTEKNQNGVKFSRRQAAREYDKAHR